MQLTLRVPSDPSCAPAAPLDSLRFEALGDFGSGEGSTSAIVLPSSLGSVLERFPPSSRALRASASNAWEAEGLAFLDAHAATLLLLPPDRPCARDGAATAGMALVALPDGSVLLVGGSGADHQGARDVSRLTPGVDGLGAVAGGLTVRRFGASATLAGSRVLVAGGGLAELGPAHDSFEVFDTMKGGFERGLAGALAVPRREHGATALPGATVLVAGGVSTTGGPALASAEIVDPERGTSEPVGDLPFARRRPELVTLDDGTVLAIGGYGDGGSPYATPGVYLFDPRTRSFSLAGGADVSTPAYPALVSVPLVGGRVAIVGDARPGLPTGVVRVLRHVLPDIGAPRFERTDVDLRASIPDLTSVRATPLPDGRFLLLGEDATATPRAFVVDVGRGRVRAVPPDASSPLLAATLANGTVLALDASSASLRRIHLVSPWDNPPDTLIEDELAFDAVGRWTARTAVTFEALVDDARFDLPSLSFRDFRVDGFRVETGDARLFLVGTNGFAFSIDVFEDRIAAGLCESARSSGADVVIERRADRIVIGDGTNEVTCRVALPERVGIAVVASAGTILRAPRIRRLALR